MHTSTPEPRISIANLIEKPNALARVGIWLMDALLGVAKMDQLYRLHKMQGLTKEAFADQLIALLKIELTGLNQLQQRIPTQGPLVIASNHPFGGIEGVILARAIGEVRPDLKVLANKGLRIFNELQDYFIFTNPLVTRDPANAPSLRQCIRHLDQGNSLLLFPAGRVSHFNHQENRTIEYRWDKIIAKLATRKDTQLLPVFVDGRNSDWFYRVERIYFKLRMFLLGRELLNKQAFRVNINSGNPITIKHNQIHTLEHGAELCRALSYAQSGEWHYQWPADKVTEQLPLSEPVPQSAILDEIQRLPLHQHLTSYKQFDVYYGYQQQIPNIVLEIARLREGVFRMHNEGSGQPLDTDTFDATYTHLFIIERHTSQIIGAYRMGQTDKLLKQSGIDGLYLHQMFEFAPEFVNQTSPCLEMGRSFLIPEYQSSFYGLLLLWRGIGAFVKKFPQYRTLYGTVSISKLYSPKSVRLIEALLIDHQRTHHVRPRTPFEFALHPELRALCDQEGASEYLSLLLQSIESDGKDIPVLVKQYQKVGAVFHALGIDASFNHTPGLLLSVHLPSAPEKLLKLYLEDDWQAYRDFQPPE